MNSGIGTGVFLGTIVGGVSALFKNSKTYKIDGEPEKWIDFVRTPALSTREHGNFYGGQWWLVPEERNDVPKDAYATAGNHGQYVIVVPSHDLVIVRRGLDYGTQGFNRWALTREVLKAFPVDYKSEE